MQMFVQTLPIGCVQNISFIHVDNKLDFLLLPMVCCTLGWKRIPNLVKKN
jgi:hypothetical protein